MHGVMRTGRIITVAAVLTAMLGLSGCQIAADGAAALPAAPMPDASSRSTPAPLRPDHDGPVRVVTIGDSIMAGYGLSPSAAWPVLLGDRDDVAVTNLGCSGAGFTVPGGCGADYDGLIPKAAAADPDLVIIQSSDNDDRSTVAQIDAATDSTLRELRTALPRAVIVGLSTLWDQPAAPPPAIAAASAALRRATGRVGGAFVDVGQPLAGRKGTLQGDAEHPTPAGQRVLAGVVTDALARVGIAL